MKLDCGNCVIRSWLYTDAAPIVPHANDYEVSRWLRDAFPHPYTLRDARDWIGLALSDVPQTSFVIEAEGEPVGSIGYTRGHDVSRFSAEIGYWLGRAHWNRGIATAALLGLTDYLFASLDLLRIYALPFADNAASMRVLEKAGYVREAYLRGAAVKEGEARDQWVYARLNPAWRYPSLS